MPKFLVCPNAFKGSLSPLEVAAAIKAGLLDADKNHDRNIEMIPLADGGDGTIESVFSAVGGVLHEINCQNTLGQNHKTKWLELDNLALVELASICGIGDLAKPAPMHAHTHGLGEVIRTIIQQHKFQNIIIALGGSASTDGGSGALYELGAKFFNAKGEEIVPSGGASLIEIVSCNLDGIYKLFSNCKIKIVTDVQNILLGDNGAAHTFAAQKGANKAEIEVLEQGLEQFASAMESTTGESKRKLSGSGAAGGTAFGLAFLPEVEIISGFSFLAEIVHLDNAISNCDIVISGEGKIDNTSFTGKTTGRLLQACTKYNKALWLVTGNIDDNVVLPRESPVKIIAATSKNKYANSSDIQQAIYQTASKL